MDLKSTGLPARVIMYDSNISQQFFPPRGGLRRQSSVRPVPPQRHHLHALQCSVLDLLRPDAGRIHRLILQPLHSREVSLSAPASNFTETKAMLTEMAAETEDLKRALGGSVTDVAAGWLTPQYLLAVREQL